MLKSVVTREGGLGSITLLEGVTCAYTPILRHTTLTMWNTTDHLQ